MITLFNPHLPNRSSGIFEEASGILAWDDIRNKTYYTIWEQMTENFWRATEISMTQDKNQWANKMSEIEKKTYRLAIGQLAVLDSVATTYDYVLSTIIKDPSIKACYAFVASMESIHNHSYTYCLTSLTNSKEANEIFNAPKEIDVMIDRNKIVMDLYDSFVNNPTKENTVKSLVANMLLEGVFFTSGFTYFYHLSRNGKMNGTQTMISLIQRDEKSHAILNSYLIRDILTENPEMNTPEFKDWVIELFKKAVQAEKDWCDYLYAGVKDINKEEIKAYVEYIASYGLDLLGLESPFEHKKVNPMRWITVYDPSHATKIKTDFFEGRELSYSKVDDSKQDWDDL